MTARTRGWRAHPAWWIAAALGLVLFVALAALQVVGSVAVRAYAARGSWVRAVPAHVARRVDRAAPSWPIDGMLRLVLARAAFARGDIPAARAALAAVPASRDTFALQAKIALAGGDAESAGRDAVRAGDLPTVTAVTDYLIARGAFARALGVQRAAIARLRADPTEGDALAEADFRLGRLEEMAAWRYAVGSRIRRAHEEASLAAYARASALSPFVERYLLALGNQALDARQYGLAEKTFVRAAGVSPNSAEPLAGLGDLALRRGDRQAAALQLARARMLDPQSPAVKRLALALGR